MYHINYQLKTPVIMVINSENSSAPRNYCFLPGQATAGRNNNINLSSTLCPLLSYLAAGHGCMYIITIAKGGKIRFFFHISGLLGEIRNFGGKIVLFE